VFVLIALAAATTADADRRLSANVALYDKVCLQAFPDDKAVEASMIALKAQPLTTEDVKVTLGDDPGRAWELADGSGTVWIEFPPYHACSVRWNSPTMVDFGPYRVIADGYEKRVGGFSAADPYDSDQGDIHVHAIGEQRDLPGGGTESLFIFDQHITDPERRAAGETGYSLRFVHQYAAPDAP
jgi:hypothetical protein